MIAPARSPHRLPVDVYLDLRHPGLFWFEHFRLVWSEGAEVVIGPGTLDVLLALVGVARLP